MFVSLDDFKKMDSYQQFIKENIRKIGQKNRLTRRTKCQKRETPEQRAQPGIRSGTQLPHARPKLPPLRKVRNIIA